MQASSFYPCPQCSQPRRFSLLGIGGTRRTVPFFQEEQSLRIERMEWCYGSRKLRMTKDRKATSGHPQRQLECDGEISNQH